MKDKLRAIEIILISILIPLLMFLSFKFGMLIAETYSEVNKLINNDWEYVEGLNSESVRERAFSEDIVPPVDVRQETDTHGGLAVNAVITAYTSSPEETSGDPCMSASGVDLCQRPIIDNTGNDLFVYVVPDLVLACPSKYEFGTMVRIENDFYICLDRMAKRYQNGNYFDIYYGMDKKGALEFGKQIKTIKIYE